MKVRPEMDLSVKEMVNGFPVGAVRVLLRDVEVKWGEWKREMGEKMAGREM